jgi:hypothetical protein
VVILQNIPRDYQIVSNSLGQPALVHLRLGLSHLPPAMSEMRIKATAIHEKTVLFVAIPTPKNTMPSIKKLLEIRRLLKFITVQSLGLTSA